jgi:hypothetical protein
MNSNRAKPLRRSLPLLVPCHRSTGTWGILRSMLGLAILLLLSSSSAGAAIFGLVDTGEIYSSGNGGTTWSVLATLPVRDAVGIAAGVSTSELFVVTRSGSVYRSTNAGAGWSGVGAITASDVAAFTITPDGSLLALTESGTLYRSQNGGVAFSAIAALTASEFVSLARGPLGRLVALTRTGEVYESQNQGSTWSAVGRITVSNAASIRRRAAELYVLTRTGEVYRSLDYGRAWLAVGAITASDMSAILEIGASLVAASESGEVYASPNGVGWTAVGAIQQLRVSALGADTPLATGVALEESPLPFSMRAPYPNPARVATGSTFAFTTARAAAQVRLELFDAHGRRVGMLDPEPFSAAGTNRVLWRPSGMAPGTYFVRATSGGEQVTWKWSLMR